MAPSPSPLPTNAVPTTKAPRKVLPFSRDDRAIVEGMRRGECWAAEEMFDRYAPAVTRMLRRTLGQERHEEMADLVHEVFAQAMDSIGSLKDPTALLAWLLRIATHTAYRTIRRRRARSWLTFREPELLPDIPDVPASAEIQQACRRLYRILDLLPATERIVFCLRFIERLELTHVADACGVSLSTAKRRVAKAQARFVALATQDAVLREWLEEGERWRV